MRWPKHSHESNHGLDLFLICRQLERINKADHDDRLDVVAYDIEGKVSAPVCSLADANHIEVVAHLNLAFEDGMLNRDSRTLRQAKDNPHEIDDLLHVSDGFNHHEFGLLASHLPYDRRHLLLIV